MNPVYSLFISLALASPLAWPQGTWKPDQRVEIVAGVSPGAGSDVTARWIQRLASEKKLIEAPSSVVNKPGGGGTIALNYLNQQPGNGHTVMVTSPTMLTNHITGRSPLSYTDVTPLAQLGSEFVIFSVRAESPIRTAQDLAERLKADPGSLSFAVGNSTGSHNHIATAQRSEEHTSELQSQSKIVCRLLLEKKNKAGAHATAYRTWA